MRKRIDFARPSISNKEVEEVSKVLKSGWLVCGPKTREFENNFAEYTKAGNAVAVNSGTSALFLSLVALGIKPREEVITTPYTFVATGNVICHIGAKPVFADIEKESFNIDPEKIEERITEKTKAIIPVHFGGSVADMDRINRIGEKYNIPIIEDAAHAVGSLYRNNKLVGNSPNVVCFSFYATKNITTAEGGMITTSDKRLADKLRILRFHGIDRDTWSRQQEKGWHFILENLGYKFTMSDINAAIGLGQLSRIKYLLQRRKEIAKIYIKGFSNLSEIQIPFKQDNRNSYHLFPILVDEKCRDDFIEKMKQEGIEMSVHFIPLHLHKYYQEAFHYKEGDFPNTEEKFKREVSLPIYPSLNLNDIQYIISKIKGYFRR